MDYIKLMGVKMGLYMIVLLISVRVELVLGQEAIDRAGEYNTISNPK